MSRTREQTRISIVDDEFVVRRAFDRLLRAGGYEPTCFASGDELLASLNGSDGSACILLDLHMPGLSGFDVLEALARNRKRIPVIVITADCDPAVSARVMQLGAASCLNKPVDESVLLRTIRTVLD
jgi:FixJ family two-component response regulator